MGKPFFRIQPRKNVLDIDFRELWNYRDLFYFLVWRDILVRYKQTVLGAAWAVIQPLAGMVVFTLFFGRLAKISSDGIPYALFSYTALVIWTFFSQSMNRSASSLISDERLVTKIYFPRLIIPTAPVIGSLLDLAISCALLLIMMPFFGMYPSVNFWAAPAMVLLTMTASLGVGVWLSALNVKYRDFRYLIPFLAQFWMFVSPVVYPMSLVPEKWRLIYALNPLAGAIEGFRWAILGTEINPWPIVAVSSFSAVAILLVGVIYFKNTERFFADLI